MSVVRPFFSRSQADKYSKRMTKLPRRDPLLRRRMLLESLGSRQLLAGNVYDDSLAEDWQNWSWDSEVDLSSSAEVFDGSAAVAVDQQSAWAGFYLSLQGQLPVSSDDVLSFAIHGGANAPAQQLFLTTPDGRWISGGSIQPAAQEWTQFEVPLNGLGESITALDGIVIQDFTGTPNSTFYIDTINVGASSDDGDGDDDNSGGDGDGSFVDAIYRDSFEGSWQNWSWSTTVNPSESTPVSEGQHSMSVSFGSEWAGLYIGNSNPVLTTDFDTIELSIHGGVGGQEVDVFVLDGDGSYMPAANLTLAGNTWTDYAINLWDIGDPNYVSGLVIQDRGQGNSASFYLDEILMTSVGEPEPEVRTGPAISVDPTTVLGTISDDVYGLNFADPELAADIGLPVNRWGGNSTTRYNYEIDTFNTASDWFFENIANDTEDESALPAGSEADKFVSSTLDAGSDAIITLNTLGWIPKSRDKVGGFSVEKYGEQQETDPWLPGYGNGVRPDGTFITGNDPYDTSIPSDETFAQGWIEHLQSQFGTAEDGGVRYYALDNEPMLWNYTHRDVHPEPASYDEVLDKGVSYAAAVKEIDPQAQVLGPTVFGWTAYFYSALDAAGEGAWWENPQDQNSHGGKPFVPWYLEQMAAAEEESGQRLLDYLDIHYYPAHEKVSLTNDGGSKQTQDTRGVITRSLWDPDYVEDTWVNDTVQLVPRMRDWIDENYPDTKLAITEYNFGAIEHYSGAIAQAEVLGIFGREGVDLATMWAPPNADDPAAYAFRMFRNYDGQGEADSRFGETSLSASSEDLESVSVFASRRSEDGALTIMLINKSDADLETPISLPPEFAGRTAEVYEYGRDDTTSIQRLDDLALSETTNVLLSRNSITLLELQPNDEANLPPIAQDDAFSTQMDAALQVEAPGVLQNDTDPEGQELTAVLLTNPQNGTLELAENGGFVYIPNSGFIGKDAFTYSASDGESESTPVTVHLDVQASSSGADGLFVLDNRRSLFEYDWSGDSEDETRLSSSNQRPRGLAVSEDGSTFWTVNLAGEVYVHDRDGNELGMWKARGLQYPEGIAIDGSDVLIVDRGSDAVHRYTDAASLLDGVSQPTTAFELHSTNRTPTDITTDGTHFWVVNNTRFVDQVFVYENSGEYLGSWVIDSANSRPTGIAVDPNDPSDIVIVDVVTDSMYVYDDAALRLGGDQSASAVYALNSRNRAPHAIAMAPSSESWTNFAFPWDVNNDKVSSPVDALAVINMLNAEGEGNGELPDRSLGQPFYDVNGDGFLSALDALQVINHLNDPTTERSRAVDLAFFDFDKGQLDEDEEDWYVEELIPFV